MPIKFGEIDSGQILENEYQIAVLKQLVQWLMKNNPSIIRPEGGAVAEMRKSALAELQKKYPKSGIKLESK